MDYETLAIDLINYLCDLYEPRTIIGMLLEWGYGPDELAEIFDIHDVMSVVDSECAQDEFEFEFDV